MLMVVIVELVRRKKLREEFSWLWLLTGVGVIVLSFWDTLLIKLANFMGIIAPVSTIFFFALVFVFSIVLHFSIKISSLTNQIKNLTQEIVLLKSSLKEDKAQA
jgi:hypothetical protein